MNESTTKLINKAARAMAEDIAVTRFGKVGKAPESWVESRTHEIRNTLRARWKGSPSNERRGISRHLRDVVRQSRSRVLVVLLLCLLFLPGCTFFIPSEVQNQCEIEAAVHAGHLASPPETVDQWRLIYTDSYDAWCVQNENVNGTPLPADVKARIESRRDPE